MAEPGVLCTYCNSPVPAAKTCLMCEASLCDDHLRVHSKSPEHILSDPTTALESRKCSVHNQTFKYYCQEDAVCLCVTCCMTKAHTEHQVEPLLEASEKLKDNLRNIAVKLASTKEEAENEIQTLQQRKRRVQDKNDGVVKEVTALFQHIRKQLDILEDQALGDISKQVELIYHPIFHRIHQLETKKDELSRKMSDVEELCNMTDPLTVLQGGKAYSIEHCDTNLENEDVNWGHDEESQSAGDLDGGLISVTLYRGLSDIMTGARKRLYVQEASDILLDIDTAGDFVDISGDLKTAKSSEKKVTRPKLLARFQYSQVLSMMSFPSGRHYWEVETSEFGNWRVGVSYPSIERGGEQSYVGDNKKSWCLGRCNRLYTVMHNKRVTYLLQKSASCEKLGIYLDYEAGRLSFYELCDPIRHLHTFTATFTEPLHAAFGVWNSYLKIKS